MRFRLRVFRFDEAHDGVPPRTSSALRADDAIALGSSDDRPIDETLRDELYCGDEFATLRDWTDGVSNRAVEESARVETDQALVDAAASEAELDALVADLPDEGLQLLARQLVADASRLADRHSPFDTQRVREDRHATSVSLRRTLVVGPVARRVSYRIAAVCLILAVGATSFMQPAFAPREDDASALRQPTPAGDNTIQPTHATLPYEHGDTAGWGKLPFDPALGAPGVWLEGLTSPEHDAVRDLLPADSEGYCDVEM